MTYKLGTKAMKLLTILSLFICFIALQRGTFLKNEKYFIGEIKYSYSYETDSLNIDTLKSKKPFKSIFRYDLNNYQSQFIGKDTFTYFYSGVLINALAKPIAKKNTSVRITA